MTDFPFLGFGCGFRNRYAPIFLEGPPAAVDWVEVIAENYLDWSDGRKPREARDLEKIRQDLPIVAHGVSLSLGSCDPLDTAHLKRVKNFLDRIEAAWFSDHLCWTGVDGTNLHDLYPLPYTEEAIEWVAGRIRQTQDILKRRILVENLSSYITYESSYLPEWVFLSEIARRADCGLLLDINNIYVSSRNHGFDPMDYLRAIPAERIGQIHLAGHSDRGQYLIDTHDRPVCDPVWNLYEKALEEKGTFSTMIERDEKFPPWEELQAEICKARDLAIEGKHSDETHRDPAPL